MFDVDVDLVVFEFFVSEEVFNVVGGSFGLMVKFCCFPVSEGVKADLYESGVLELYGYLKKKID